MTQDNHDDDSRSRDTNSSREREFSKRRGDSSDDERGNRSAPERRLASLALRGPHILVWTAATGDTFTICRPDGHTVAHDRFHPDLIIDTDTVATESAALQGIWLAALARDMWGADVATVRVVTAATVADPGLLRRAAFTSSLALELAVDTVTNPATEHRQGVWVDWRRTDLTRLIQHPRSPQ